MYQSGVYMLIQTSSRIDICNYKSKNKYDDLQQEQSQQRDRKHYDRVTSSYTNEQQFGNIIDSVFSGMSRILFI